LQTAGDGPPIVIFSFPAWVKSFQDEIQYYQEKASGFVYDVTHGNTRVDRLNQAGAYEFQDWVNGYPDGRPNRLLGKRGPETRHVIMATQDAYKTAATIAAVGQILQGGVFFAASNVSGVNTVSTFKGIPMYGNTSQPASAPSGFAQYARADAQIQAEVARDNWLQANPGSQPGAMVGATDIKGGFTTAMTSGQAPSIFGSRIGGLLNGLTGPSSSGTPVGCCAEQRAANFLELNYGTRPSNIIFTQPNIAKKRIKAGRSAS
jgi:hypothetical protein